MKIAARFVSILSLAALSLGLGTAGAQDIQTVTVKFPFSVTVGSRTLPAGDYTISTFDFSSDAPIFLVRGAHGSAIAFATARTEAAPHTLTKDDVVLAVDGDKHILTQVRLQDTDSVYEIVRPSKK